MTKIQMTETLLYDIWFRSCNLMGLRVSLEQYGFEFVSDFDIRISNLSTPHHHYRFCTLTMTPPRGRDSPETSNKGCFNIPLS